MTEPLPRAYKPWLVLSIAVLVGSLVLLAVVVAIGFVQFGQAALPLWVVLLGVLAVLGIVAGFAGFLGLMLLAGWRSFREGRRVQVLPPEHGDRPPHA